jgi:hypothetical protein
VFRVAYHTLHVTLPPSPGYKPFPCGIILPSHTRRLATLFGTSKGRKEQKSFTGSNPMSARIVPLNSASLTRSSVRGVVRIHASSEPAARTASCLVGANWTTTLNALPVCQRARVALPLPDCLGKSHACASATCFLVIELE